MIKSVLKIDWIRGQVKKGNYYLSRHADSERQFDGLSLIEVEEALLTGRILEQYEDTGRGYRSLVVGFSQTGKPIHVVCGVREKYLVLVTIYIPCFPKFKTPYERG
ncbi:MAG: DUF4258 domain-containing protein [Chlamydiae bacterium]|nr:DUF4258 domain-containing protein [Chlamydiota bacterium]